MGKFNNKLKEKISKEGSNGWRSYYDVNAFSGTCSKCGHVNKWSMQASIKIPKWYGLLWLDIQHKYNDIKFKLQMLRYKIKGWV